MWRLDRHNPRHYVGMSAFLVGRVVSVTGFRCFVFCSLHRCLQIGLLAPYPRGIFFQGTHVVHLVGVARSFVSSLINILSMSSGPCSFACHQILCSFSPLRVCLFFFPPRVASRSVGVGNFRVFFCVSWTYV